MLGDSMTSRSAIHYFVTVSLGIAFASNVLADVPPVLEAKGKQQQCDSLEAWTRKAQELGGEDVIGGDIWGNMFAIKIAPAFADSVFEPLIGKPYRDLSKREKKKILKIVDRCVTQAGTQGFLPYAFDTSARTNNSTRRDLMIALENVTDEDAAQAQLAADARAERQRQFYEGRPERVARSIPADPKAIKRRKLTKRMCHASKVEWRFLYNDYVFDGDAVVASTDEWRNRYDQPCSNGIAMQRFVPDVTSLLRIEYPIGALLAVGDICGKDPEILFLYPQLNTELPKYDQFTPSAVRRGQGSQHFRSRPYMFYVPSGSDGVLQDGIINRVESGLLATREVVLRQCQSVPESIRVVGGTIRQGFGPQKFDRNKYINWPESLEYWEFYSGTFYPNEPEKRLVHGDPRMAATYSAYAKAYAEYVLARRAEYEKRGDGSLALGFLALMIVGKYLANPCNDTDIPYQDRANAGCFRP